MPYKLNTKMAGFNKTTKAEKVTLAVLLAIFAVGTTILFVNDGKLIKPKNNTEYQKLIEPIKVTTD